MAMDHSPWEGITVDGAIDTVISRGEVIVDANGLHGRVGRGRFLRRDRPAVLR